MRGHQGVRRMPRNLAGCGEMKNKQIRFDQGACIGKWTTLDPTKGSTCESDSNSYTNFEHCGKKKSKNLKQHID